METLDEQSTVSSVDYALFALLAYVYIIAWVVSIIDYRRFLKEQRKLEAAARQREVERQAAENAVAAAELPYSGDLSTWSSNAELAPREVER